jgi:hypothetical protein
MGAVTSLMYGDRDPTIAGMVLDSPFSSLKMLVEELVKEKVSLPSFVLNQALKLVKSTVQKKANFKLDDIEPILFAKRCFIPALFVAAQNDNFVKPHHAKILNDAYPGDKNLISIDGDHNSLRPRFFKDSAAIFFYNTLQVQFIKEISDNYAGFKHPVSKEDTEHENPHKKILENVINIDSLNLSSNVNNSIQSSHNENEPLIEINNTNNFNEKGKYITDHKIDLIDMEEDEEDIFNKIIELSKKEFEDEQKKGNNP